MFNHWAIELDFIHAAVIVLVQCSVLLHILITKHENPPQAAFWLILVALLPGAGLLCYIFFGITHLEHVHNVILKIRSQLNLQANDTTQSLAENQRALQGFLLKGEESLQKNSLMLDRLFRKIRH